MNPAEQQEDPIQELRARLISDIQVEYSERTAQELASYVAKAGEQRLWEECIWGQRLGYLLALGSIKSADECIKLAELPCHSLVARRVRTAGRIDLQLVQLLYQLFLNPKEVLSKLIFDEEVSIIQMTNLLPFASVHPLEVSPWVDEMFEEKRQTSYGAAVRLHYGNHGLFQELAEDLLREEGNVYRALQLYKVGTEEGLAKEKANRQTLLLLQFLEWQYYEMGRISLDYFSISQMASWDQHLLMLQLSIEQGKIQRLQSIFNESGVEFYPVMINFLVTKEFRVNQCYNFLAVLVRTCKEEDAQSLSNCLVNRCSVQHHRLIGDFNERFPSVRTAWLAAEAQCLDTMGVTCNLSLLQAIIDRELLIGDHLYNSMQLLKQIIQNFIRYRFKSKETVFEGVRYFLVQAKEVLKLLVKQASILSNNKLRNKDIFTIFFKSLLQAQRFSQVYESIDTAMALQSSFSKEHFDIIVLQTVAQQISSSKNIAKSQKYIRRLLDLVSHSNQQRESESAFLQILLHLERKGRLTTPDCLREKDIYSLLHQLSSECSEIDFGQALELARVASRQQFNFSDSRFTRILEAASPRLTQDDIAKFLDLGASYSPELARIGIAMRDRLGQQAEQFIFYNAIDEDSLRTLLASPVQEEEFQLTMSEFLESVFWQQPDPNYVQNVFRSLCKGKSQTVKLFINLLAVKSEWAFQMMPVIDGSTVREIVLDLAAQQLVDQRVAIAIVVRKQIEQPCSVSSLSEEQTQLCRSRQNDNDILSLLLECDLLLKNHPGLKFGRLDKLFMVSYRKEMACKIMLGELVSAAQLRVLRKWLNNRHFQPVVQAIQADIHQYIKYSQQIGLQLEDFLHQLYITVKSLSSYLRILELVSPGRINAAFAKKCRVLAKIDTPWRTVITQTSLFDGKIQSTFNFIGVGLESVFALSKFVLAVTGDKLLEVKYLLTFGVKGSLSIDKKHLLVSRIVKAGKQSAVSVLMQLCAESKQIAQMFQGHCK